MIKKYLKFYFSDEQKARRFEERKWAFFKGQKPPKNEFTRNAFVFYRLFGKLISFISTAAASFILIMILTCTIVGTVIAVYLVQFTYQTNVMDLTTPQQLMSSNIYQRNSETDEYELVYRVSPPGGNKRINIDISDLSDYVKFAFVCVEDERFYAHNGVDYKRTGAAIINLALESVNLSDSHYGGSTITQQLIKNVTGDDQDSWERKMREIFTAMKLEKKYTKDEILQHYLNEIYFSYAEGYNMYGIEAASIGYFGKSASDLSIAEAACLAAIPKAPNDYNPIYNYEENRERQLYCLSKMFELGVITSDQYEEAVQEKVITSNMEEFDHKDNIITFKDNDSFDNPDVNSDAVDCGIIEFTDFLQNTKGYLSTEAALDEFKKGGYDIYLTVDDEIQNLLEDKYAKWYDYFPQETADNSDEKVQSAFTVMNYKGEILGVIGRIGPKSDSLCWNNAYDAHRQCGSTIKPVSTYGYAIENNKITWSSMFDDKSLAPGVADKEAWPQNYDGDPSLGTYPVNYFLKRSINTLPAQICNLYGLDNIFGFATGNMHLELENEDKVYSALAIGGTRHGPTIINLTNAYLPYGNGGMYYKASIIEKAVNNNTGEVMIDNELKQGERAVSKDTAYVMNKLLQNNVRGVNGTGAAAALANKSIGGKTGTTENWRDIEFVGLTPDFAAGIWIGYQNGENPEAIENANSARIWYSIFGEFADSYKSNAEFPKDSTVLYRRYCSQTGLLANENCPGSDYGYYRESNCQYCDVHGGKQETAKNPDFSAKKSSASASNKQNKTTN